MLKLPKLAIWRFKRFITISKKPIMLRKLPNNIIYKQIITTIRVISICCDKGQVQLPYIDFHCCCHDNKC